VSEILVIADASAHPDWVAMDLFSQAEQTSSPRRSSSRPTPR
jgi:histidinol dehydrogenase